MMDQELLDRKTAAHVLGDISLRLLDHLVSRKELRAVKIGRRTFFRRKDLERFAQRDHRMLHGKSSS